MRRQSRIYNPTGFYRWKHQQALEKNIDEVRYWMLTCDSCGHEGGVEATLRKLRAANLICTECSEPLRKRA